MITKEIIDTYIDILNEELLVAMGCTEPIAIAYASSVLRNMLKDKPKKIKAGFSGNIIKNVKSVIVPATGGMHGLKAAVCAGIVANAPDSKLEVLCSLKKEDASEIKAYHDLVELDIYELETDNAFEVDLVADGAHVHFEKRHTNITLAECDGIDYTDKYSGGMADTVIGESVDRSSLNVEDIIEFADTVDIERVRPLIEKQIELNMAIAKEGINGEWGACIGKTLLNGGTDTRIRARAFAAAGSDARMSGCEMPVCIISGSGNQGMTATIPVVIYARDMDATREQLIRALLVSDLITIHQKTGIGCLSAYCGAISAGCGAGCGICYLKGGRFREIAHTLVNAIAILSGTICDGAKPSCAAKIAMAVEAGILGYEMMKAGHQFYGGDGIVVKGVENTIKNIGRLAREGMSGTDKEIIKIMLEAK
ncbi:MAG: serine dehydratase subunit alpha family protein [Clostridia bacterium]|nr:serine dehydratase subunit alpha family protein [Clostridia bacterium]